MDIAKEILPCDYKWAPCDVLHFITSLDGNIIKCDIFILHATDSVHVAKLYFQKPHLFYVVRKSLQHMQ